MAVRVVSDSACDLPAETCAALGIEIVPLTIRFGSDEYVDRTELSTDDFWKKLQASSVLPETAAPSVGAFEETFRALLAAAGAGLLAGGAYALTLLVLRTPELGSLLAVLRRREPAEV